MTWILGASSILGHGLMVSDVRISFADGTEKDLLRKTYQIGPYLLAGFAGSVNIGMRLIGSLQNMIASAKAPDNTIWRPDFVAENWAPIARQVFNASAIKEREAGSQVLMVGISPNEDLGVPEFKRVYVTRFNWPDFIPEHLPKGMSVCHIGSGADVSHYREGIEGYCKLGDPNMVKAMLGGIAPWAMVVSATMGRLAADHPLPGIGSHVFVDAVAYGEFWAGTNDRTEVHPNGRRVEFAMPKVATNYPDFVDMCKNLGKAAALAKG